MCFCGVNFFPVWLCAFVFQTCVGAGITHCLPKLLWSSKLLDDSLGDTFRSTTIHLLCFDTIILSLWVLEPENFYWHFFPHAFKYLVCELKLCSWLDIPSLLKRGKGLQDKLSWYLCLLLGWPKNIACYCLPSNSHSFSFFVFSKKKIYIAWNWNMFSFLRTCIIDHKEKWGFWDLEILRYLWTVVSTWFF